MTKTTYVGNFVVCVCCFIKFYRRVIIFWQNKMWGISFLSCIQLEEYECVTV